MLFVKNGINLFFVLFIFKVRVIVESFLIEFSCSCKKMVIKVGYGV